MFRPIDTAILANRGQLAFPQPGPGQFKNLSRLDALDELFERPLYGSRVGAFSTQAGRFLEEPLIKHKICTFHAHEL